MCEAIYIGNTQKTLKKIMDGNLSDLLRFLKNRQKSYSFSDHLEQNFNSNTSRKDLHKYMTLKVLKQLNPIGAMKTFTKPKCNFFMEELLKILKTYVTKSSRL